MEKKFENPELIIVLYNDDDVIATSFEGGWGTGSGAGGDDWSKN